MGEMLPYNAQQKRMQQNCQGCYYHTGWCCDYILIEKRRRPCRPGDECTVRKKRGTSREESLVVVSRKHAQLPPKPAPTPGKKPYTVQVKYPRPVIRASPSQKTVFNQTTKPKPKSSAKPTPQKPWDVIRQKLDAPEIAQMYDSGASDAAIGKVVGCCANSVRKWRIQTGRPVKSRHAPKQGMKVLFDRMEEIKADLAAGKTDYSLCRKYDVSQRTFGRFREKYNLGPARGKRKENDT